MNGDINKFLLYKVIQNQYCHLGLFVYLISVNIEFDHFSGVSSLLGATSAPAM